MAKNKGLTIDWESADRITLLSLIDQHEIVTSSLKKLRKRLKEGKELKACEKQDLVDQETILVHMAAVIKYYGGDVNGSN